MMLFRLRVYDALQTTKDSRLSRPVRRGGIFRAGGSVLEMHLAADCPKLPEQIVSIGLA
jgi:hypothetical protein